MTIQNTYSKNKHLHEKTPSQMIKSEENIASMIAN